MRVDCMSVAFWVDAVFEIPTMMFHLWFMFMSDTYRFFSIQAALHVHPVLRHLLVLSSMTFTFMRHALTAQLPFN